MINCFDHNYSTAIYDENNVLMDVFLNEKEDWHLNIEDDIPDNLKNAVINYEDKNFYKHFGVDFLSIIRAIKNNIIGNRRSGASTITMQLVKLYEPKKRTYLNKFIEIIQAIKIETKISKDLILRLYLNNAPYGGNIVGYGTASRMYFQKEPKNLSWAECSLIAVLPNSPGLINVEKNREKLINKRNNLIYKLYNKNFLSKEQYELSIKEPLPPKKYSFERVVPHLARRLYNSKIGNNIKTTINYELQKKIQNVVNSYMNYTKTEGIVNACALVIDNKTYDVKSYIGSQDFMDMDNAGQVDGIIAKRSPGSILKPFLYALSIDDGLIAPESLVQDVPMFFANFNPQNANKKYSGMISAKNALISSLNIPFVHLLNQYGEDRFYYFLKNLLEFDENSPEKYGLSLILGTKEFSVEDIATMYTGLANYGKYQELNYIKDENNKKQKKMFSAGSSYLAIDALKDLVRPGINNFYKLKKTISWKTGTSFGKKDAWACGITPDWTVAVWVGNFSGKGNDNLSGATSAGSLLFNIFENLNIDDEFVEPDYDIKKINVDKITGYRINFDDVETKTIKYPKSAKPLRLSPYYKKIYIDEKGNEIDSRDPNFLNSQVKIILNYPLEVINYFIRENYNVSEFYNTNTKEKSLKILYPTPNLKILLPKDLDKEQKLIVKIANLKKQNVYWYLDKNFLKVSKNFEEEIELGVGEHILTIMSEDGEIEKTSFTIEKTIH